MSKALRDTATLLKRLNHLQSTVNSVARNITSLSATSQKLSSSENDCIPLVPSSSSSEQSLSTFLQSMIQPIQKTVSSTNPESVKGANIIQSARRVQSMAKKMGGLAQKHGSEAGENVATAATGCITSVVANHVKQKSRREIGVLAEEFQELSSKLWEHLPQSLLNQLEGLVSAMGTKSFDIGRSMSELHRFAKEFPARIVETQLKEVDELRDEILGFDKLKNILVQTEKGNGTDRREIVRDKLHRLFEKLKDMRIEFMNVASQGFVQTVLQPLAHLFKVMAAITKEMTKCWESLPSFRDALRDMVHFVLTLDTRLLKAFQPPAIIMLCVSCFFSIPDEISQFVAEVKQIKDKFVLGMIEPLIVNLVDGIGTGAAKGLMDTIHKSISLYKDIVSQLHRQLVDQHAQLEELVTLLSDEVEEEILELVDQLLESSLAKTFDSVFQKAVDVKNWTLGAFGMK